MSAAMLGQLYDAVCGESAVVKDGYLTWLSPGVPFEPGHVAELVDVAGEGRLSAVYADVLRRCLVVRGELSDAELLKVRRYRTLLRGNGTHVDPATGDERTVTEDAPMFRAYQEHLAGYLAAELRCNLARVAGGSGWEADGPRHVAAVRDAMDAWLATGYRDEVEQVHAYLDQINRRDLACWREHLIELYDGGLLGATPHTTLVPAAAGWCDWTFDPGDAQPRVRRPSWRAGTADFPACSPPPVLSCQLALVVVSRPWFFPELLDSRGWTLPAGELLCDGGDPPSGRLVGYPTAVLLARDLRIVSPELVAAHPSARLPGWGPFGLTGAVADGPTLRVAGVQAIGFVNRQLGRTPNPLPVLDPARFV